MTLILYIILVYFLTGCKNTYFFVSKFVSAKNVAKNFIFPFKNAGVEIPLP
jgi:hypothetical protein